jgi:hypothetical protein
VGNCGLCHAQTWLEIPSGRKLEMDKKTPHSCKGHTVQVVQQLPMTAREKRIDELVTRTAAFERIAAALEKNNNQNVAARQTLGRNLVSIQVSNINKLYSNDLAI